jgi:hypothetical protein
LLRFRGVLRFRGWFGGCFDGRFDCGLDVSVELDRGFPGGKGRPRRPFRLRLRGFDGGFGVGLRNDFLGLGGLRLLGRLATPEQGCLLRVEGWWLIEAAGVGGESASGRRDGCWSFAADR